MDGILPVYKPPAMSSHDVVRFFKKHQHFSGKIGHAGTLDVFAEGVLILLLGSATKLFDDFQQLKKTYQAGSRLGLSSSTLDIEGVLVAQSTEQKPTRSDLEKMLPVFIGKLEQKIPSFSAAKHKGQPLYKYAREGIKIEKSKTIEVYDIQLISYMYPLVILEITCSSGTYIRQLTYDILHTNSIESFLYFLKRTAAGPITTKECCSLHELSSDTWLKYLKPSIAAFSHERRS